MHFISIRFNQVTAKKQKKTLVWNKYAKKKKKKKMFIIPHQWDTSTSVWIQESCMPPRSSLDPSADNSSAARIAIITKRLYKPETIESNLCDLGGKYDGIHEKLYLLRCNELRVHRKCEGPRAKLQCIFSTNIQREYFFLFTREVE